MKKIFYFSIALFTFACQKEPIIETNPRYVEQDKIFEQTDFSCKQEPINTIPTYFRGTLNNQPICYYDGIEYHAAYEGLVNVITSSTPNFTIENSKLSKQFWLGFGVFTLDGPNKQALQIINPIAGDSTIRGWIEKKIIENKELTILDRTNSGGAPYTKIDGFMINLLSTGDPGTGKYDYLGQVSSAFGTQSKKSYFRPISVKKGSVAGFEYYDLEFDIRCELFKIRNNPTQIEPDAFFAVLEGKYHTRLWI